MKKNNTFFFVTLVTLIAGMAALPARADAFSFGLGVSNGDGGFFSFGMSNGGRDAGHGFHGRGPHHPAPVVCAPRPVYYAPRPVVYAPPPVVVTPAPVIVTAPPPPATVVVNSGYWQEREERTWIEGVWIESYDSFGRRVKQWQPGHWEVRRTRVWVE